jgi:ectoine hydroxylase-related dioxygenase (phytanoyl-CoA dioxygenase family)
MLYRRDDRNFHIDGPASEATQELESQGHTLLRGVFTPAEVAALKAEIEAVYREVPAEMRNSAITREVGEMYRYQMFNHSALCQAAIGHERILSTLEPLLGASLHVIACTSWRNPPGAALTPHGLQWHLDSGPMVTMPPGQTWPAGIPYPIFIVGSHIYLQDVCLDDGPTACIPGSHRSGRCPPDERMWDLDLEWNGQKPVHHIAQAGDVDLRVSDIWHRRWPPTVKSKGRFFLQTNYARRDIAQRIVPTERLNAISPAALARAQTPAQRTLLGLHPQSYFDA